MCFQYQVHTCCAARFQYLRSSGLSPQFWLDVVQALPSKSARKTGTSVTGDFWITTKSKYSQALACCKLVHFWMFLVQKKYVALYSGLPRFQCLTLRANILAKMLVFYLLITLQMCRLDDSAGHD